MEGVEWLITLGIGAALFFLLPKALPKLMNSAGRAVGEFRKGRLQTERELQELNRGTNR